MQIENIKVKGIGPFFGEYEIPAAELDEIVAVTGHNGAGKTFLLECIPGALYGYFPFRMYKQAGITIYDMVTPGLEAFIEMIFSVAGRRFRITRNIERRGTWKGNTFKETGKNQNVIIEEDVAGEWISRAEKTKAVNEFVETEICPQQLFLASAFNSQNSAGDIVDCGADERKLIFANIIGLGELQGKAELFLSRVQYLDKMINQQETLRDAESARLIDDAVLKSETEQARNNIAQYASDRESLLGAQELLLEQKARFDGIAGEIKQATARRNELRAAIETKKQEAEKLSQMIIAKGSINQKVLELQANKGLLEQHEQQLETMGKQLAGMRGIEQDISDTRMEIQKALMELRGEYGRAENDLSVMKRRADKAKVEWQTAQARQEETAMLDALDCEKNCKFVSKALEARRWLDENPVESFEQLYMGAVQIVKEHADRLAEIEKRITSRDHEKAFSDRLAGLETKLAEFTPLLNKQEEMQRDAKALKSKISMLEANRVEQKLAQVEMAEQQHPGVMSEIEQLEKSLVEAVEQFNKLSVQSLDDPAERLQDIKRRIAGMDEMVRMNEKTAIQNEQKLRDNMQGKMKVRLHEAMIAKYQRLRGGYERLKGAFGRSGIQALVIDSEKMQFLDIARELFGILSGGKMALYFQTQKTLKSGEVREDFDLNLTVEGVTRKLEQCSMGQQDLGRMVMRATLGIYHAVKSGSRIQTYFLDETTGSLDEINRENYFEFLKYLLNYFKQIYVISHQDVARIIPCRIQITDDHKVEI